MFYEVSLISYAVDVDCYLKWLHWFADDDILLDVDVTQSCLADAVGLGNQEKLLRL